MWKMIHGYSSPYQINKKGTVRHFLKRGLKPGKWVVMTPNKNAFGHLSIPLYKSPCVVSVMLHRLLWEAFVGKIPKGAVINHKNSKPADNRLSNLEVTSQMRNCWHGAARRARELRKEIGASWRPYRRSYQ